MFWSEYTPEKSKVFNHFVKNLKQIRRFDFQKYVFGLALLFGVYASSAESLSEITRIGIFRASEFLYGVIFKRAPLPNSNWSTGITMFCGPNRPEDVVADADFLEILKTEGLFR